MLFVREHVEDGVSTLTVLDVSSGDAFSFSSDSVKHDYAELVEEVSEIVASGGDIQDAKNVLVQQSKFDDIREKYGITIGEQLVINNEFTDFESIVFPVEIGDVFKDITTEEELHKFMKFLNLLDKNPYSHAKSALVEWIIQNPSLTILEDGRIRGYRGLTTELTSIHSGYGIVNGVEVNSQLDNTPGNIIEFPVSLVDHNPNNYCSVGLHVGTLDYAVGFGKRYVTVAFSPEHVVSSPADSRYGKIRVSRMEILEEITNVNQFRKDLA